MPFAYFDQLSDAEKIVYLRSDGIGSIRLPRPEELLPLVEAVRRSLEANERAALEQATQRLCNALTTRLEVPPVEVEVLEVRPSDRRGELHGLYTAAPGEAPKIRVWMKTARKARVVAFRTYLRTVLHELCHHLDFELLDLPISFHTQGFFKRESSLFHQLVPEAKAT